MQIQLRKNIFWPAFGIWKHLTAFNDMIRSTTTVVEVKSNIHNPIKMVSSKPITYDSLMYTAK